MSSSSDSRVDHSGALGELVGRQSGPPSVGPDLVNEPMIRHWAEAMGDANPIYVDDDAAHAVGLEGIIAPPTMLQAWIMVGLSGTLAREAARLEAPKLEHETANDAMMRLLDEEGFTSVVATNCEQEYVRPLKPGERIAVSSVIESISDVKTTGLGTGRFATTRTDFFAVADPFPSSPEERTAALGAGDPVGTMRFRILKFAPGKKAPAKPPRPRPAITEDNAYFFEGLQGGALLLQRCSECLTLRHPSLPACGQCGSLEWDTVESKGAGELYSFVVVHYPQVPSFDYPLPIGLIALDEGPRIVANLAMDPSDATIGMRLQATITAFDDELSLPVFGPAQA
ncbi:MAG: OB-fold domain-containing protein [Actinomycetes bacterium]